MLRASKEVAERELKARIEEGELLFGRKQALSEADFLAFKDDVRSWRETTSTVLRSVFASEDPAVEFSRNVGTPPRQGSYLKDRVEVERQNLHEYLRRVKLLVQSVMRSDDINGKEPESRTQRIFIVHGRDGKLREAIFAFLRAIGLNPIEWNQAAALTGVPAPYIGQILDAAFRHAQAVVVVLSPDDEVRLRPELTTDSDSTSETEIRRQARPNVLFEAGTAFATHPNKTVLVEIGDVKPFSDVAGRHVIRLDNTVKSRQEFAQRLEKAGCDVDLSGTDWHTQGHLSPVPSRRTRL